MEETTVVAVDAMGEALSGITDALTAGFNSLNSSLVVAVGAIIAAGLVLFGIKFAPKFLKSLFKSIAAQQQGKFPPRPLVGDFKKKVVFYGYNPGYMRDSHVGLHDFD